jgi:hypothetical protein
VRVLHWLVEPVALTAKTAGTASNNNIANTTPFFIKQKNDG